jgi:phage-related protein
MAAAGAIFGKNQMSSWLALINTAPSEVDALSESIKNSTGTTQEMADAMMSGFGGSIEKLKSSLDVLVTSLGSIIAEYLTPVIEKIQGVIDMFMAMDEETKKQIVTIAGIVAAIGPVLLVGGKIISGIGTIVSAMGTVATFIGGTLIPAITAISAPVLAVVAAVAALAAGFVYLYKTNDDFRNKVNELVSGIKENFGQMIETIKPALDELFTTIKEVVGELVEAFKQFMKDAEPVFEFIATGIAGVINGVMQAATPIINAVNSIIKMVSSVVKGLFSLLTGDFKGFASNMKDALKSMLDAIKSLLEAKLAFFKGIFETFGSDIGAKAMQWGIDLINNLVEGIKSMIDRVGDAISDVADVIASFIHFSEPDQGSLANFNSFMPDMMRQMASGITKGIPMVENAMDNLTKTMVPTMGGINVSGAGGTNNNISNAVSINVYGAQGQDVNALAEIIQDKINSAVYNRGAVFA